MGDHVQINIAMKVGSVSERIEVTANAAMVQTQQNTISQVIDQQRIVDLPLNGRDATQLITISGASINHSDGTNTGSKSFFSSQSISIAGSAGNATNYLLDGGDNNDSFTNVNMPFPFPDALQEFSVETSTLPARNGLHPGGVVNAVTKSGTNTLARRAVRVHPQRRRQRDQLLRAAPGQPEAQPVRRHIRRQDHPRQAVLLRRISALQHSPGPVFQHRVRPHRRRSRRRLQRARRRRVPVEGRRARHPRPDHGQRRCRASKIAVSRFDPASVALAKYLPTNTDPCGKATYGIPIQSNESQIVSRVDWI